MNKFGEWYLPWTWFRSSTQQGTNDNDDDDDDEFPGYRSWDEKGNPIFRQ